MAPKEEAHEWACLNCLTRFKGALSSSFDTAHNFHPANASSLNKSRRKINARETSNPASPLAAINNAVAPLCNKHQIELGH